MIANIGNLFKNVGLYSKAIESLQKAVGIDPSDQFSHNRLSSALAKEKEEEVKVEALLEETRMFIAQVDDEQVQSG